MRFLLLKAILRGGAATDLFATPVNVAGYTTKEGTYVAPHLSTRKKRHDAPSPAPALGGDLFDQPHTPKPAQPDLFNQPARPPEPKPAPVASKEEPAEAPQAPKEEPAAPSVPEGIIRRVRIALGSLQGIAEQIERVRQTIDGPMARGNGRYEADVLNNRRADIEVAEKFLRRFRDIAAEKGVDADAIFAENGGKPDLAPSEAARAWMEDDRTKKEEAAKPPAQQEAAPAKPAEEVAVWGVPSGTSASARRKLNAQALEILEAKRDDQMTPEDRAALARYTGNGGCGDSLNEFYTDPAVAGAMWQMLAKAGFKGGLVLEPSCGTGVFLRTAPADAKVVGVELDPVSARIASILHPQHDVRQSSLERFATQDGELFDAVIGNAPFGVRGDCTKGDPDKRDIGKHEQYFLDTGLDKLRDGGLMAMIVDTGVMNSKNGRAFRERLLRKAEFIGAHRLPNTAFKAANTDVTTDILLFRKRPADVAGALGSLTQKQLRAAGVWDADFLAGYFEKSGAENVYGSVGTAMRAFGPIYTVNGEMDGVAEALARWEPPAPGEAPTMQHILASLGDDQDAKRKALDASQKRPYQQAKLGDIKVIDGVRCILQGDPPRWHKLEAAVPEAVTDALKIADGLEDLLQGRAKDPALVRAEVAEELDRYISQHGLPTKNKDLRAWLAAPALDREAGETPGDHHARVTAAMHRAARMLGVVNEDGSYSDLVTGRMEKKTSVGIDGVATLLAADHGGFTVDQLAAQTGKSVAEVLDHLHASPAFAIEAGGREWTTMDMYLSGQLWPKLDAAKEALAHEGLSPEYRAKYEAQVAALEEAISPASLEDVEIMLNSGFVTPANINAFFKHRFDEAQAQNYQSYRSAPVTVTYDDGVYVVKGDRWDHRDLLDKFLNRTGVRKDDRDTLEQLNKDFAEWVRTGPLRDEIEDRYNRLYKGFRQREYSDAPMQVPGLTQAFTVNGYHYSGLRWALEEGKGIIADDVGLGKTGRGLMLAKLLKVHGKATKPTFVVPKSVLANWVEETQTWFPGSRVLVIGESYEQNPDGSWKRDAHGKLVGKADTEAQRRAKYHSLQQNSYDFVLISRPSWDKLDLSPIKKGDYANDEFWTKRADKLGKAGDKRLQKIRDAHDQALAKRDFKDREGTIYFDDLGIDCLIMDEGHAYKNLFSVNNRFGMSPKFLGGTGESNRAQDTYFKSKWVRENNGGRGVYMMTATPTKNSPLEVYSMLSHIAPEAFERMGIRNAEDFVDRFVEFVDEEVFGVDGEMEPALVTAGFKNLGELREVMRRYINRRTAEDVGLQIPEAEKLEHLLDMTPEQESIYQRLRQEAAAARSNKSDSTGESHIFSIMDRMQKASTDPELLGLSDTVSPKFEAVADKAVKNSEDGGQIIFCEPVDSHERIAAALVKRGVPRNQIAIINAKVAPSSSERQKISDAFNAGTVKFVIGNKTMEEGVNLQKRTSDIHHIDIPWEPATLQQRNGRGRRQGNKRKNIRIHTYLAKKSFDVYRHQTIAAKRNWQDLLWNGGDRVENLAREGRPSLRDMSVMLAPDPEAAMAKLAADKEAAIARKQISDRARAAESFRRFRLMKANYAKLVEEKRSDTEAAARLKMRLDRARELLEKDKSFPHKDFIGSDEAAIIEPVTGIAWRKGMGLEVVGGKDSPIETQDDKPERFVVDIVDQDNNRVWCRPLVAGSRAFPVSLKAEQMQSGVTPYQHSEAAEREANAAYARTIGAEKLKTATAWKDIMALPPETVAENAAELQARLKAAHANHDASIPYGDKMMLGPDGTPKVVESYNVRDAIKTHDFMLPSPDHREKALQAYVEESLGRKLETRFREHGRRRSSYGFSSEAIGMKPSYPGASYSSKETHPWEHQIKKVFGSEAADEGNRRVVARVAENVAAAPDMHNALKAASVAAKVDWNYTATSAWPAAVVKALWQKGEATGALDKPLRESVFPPHVGVTARSSDAAGHSRLYQDGIYDWLSHARDVRGGPPTLRRFLQLVAPHSIKRELQPEGEQAA